MCDHLTVVIRGRDEGNVEVTVQAPPDANPSMLREVRDQAVGTYTDALRAQSTELLAFVGATSGEHPEG